ncbi:hypothetical protein ACTWPB_29000 [Nocardia sp. IBHARD005]|uniref:hypothetical protein n=1 Tax=Nocardia sp. IBHARD005 TaxID=3457765 RepID=UPI0040586139
MTEVPSRDPSVVIIGAGCAGIIAGAVVERRARLTVVNNYHRDRESLGNDELLGGFSRFDRITASVRR